MHEIIDEMMFPLLAAILVTARCAGAVSGRCRQRDRGAWCAR
jgi:hypothetical protein